jgi:hypothetical protein
MPRLLLRATRQGRSNSRRTKYLQEVPSFDIHVSLSLAMTNVAINGSVILTMTSDAEGHIIKPDPWPDLGHCLHLTMTFLAGDSLGHMRIVVEVDEIRKDVDPHPPDRLLRFKCLTDLCNPRPGCRDELMAAHAQPHRRDSGRCRTPHAAVTVLAVHLVLARVDRVAEGDGLARASIGSITAREKKQAKNQYER